MKASSRIAKSAIITNLVNSIRDSSTQPGGGFVRFDNASGMWYEVGEKVARDKVGQALRDAARLRKENRKPMSSYSHRDDDPCRAGPITSAASETMYVGKRLHSPEKLPQKGTGPVSPSSPAISKNYEKPKDRASVFHFEHDRLSMIMPTAPPAAVEGTTSSKATADETEGDLSSSHTTGSMDSDDSDRRMQESSSRIETAGALSLWFENDV
mmetsp:Transcript_38299/g.92653  ORF Transcript_38299/g.92653 Transcript_38299/m.92653 type:complete len:212 (-) Transcript_38299:547-1182(-)